LIDKTQLDLLDASLGTAHTVSACLQFGFQYGGLLFCGSSALLGFV